MKDNNYKKVIASILKCKQDQIFLYWKGRVALYAILKAMGIKEGDEIVLSNVEEIIQIANRHNIFTIEDCTHGFSGYYNGKPNGSYCDAAFYSTQWNKPFSTGIGGFLVVNKSEFVNKVEMLESNKVKPSFMDKNILAFLLIFNRFFVNSFTYWTMVKFYRFLSKNNLVIGSNQGDELSGVEIPKKYFKDISSVQVNAGISQLNQLEKVNQFRKKNAVDYTQFLKLHSKIFVNEVLFDIHLFLKYPLLVKDRELFLKLAEKEKIALGDWFLSPLHPVEGSLKMWNFNSEFFPQGTSISKKMVNLPTDIEDNSKVLKFLTSNIEMIE